MPNQPETRQITASCRQLSVMFPSYTAEGWRRLAQLGRIPGATKLFRRGKWLIPIASVTELLETNHERDAA